MSDTDLLAGGIHAEWLSHAVHLSTEVCKQMGKAGPRLAESTDRLCPQLMQFNDCVIGKIMGVSAHTSYNASRVCSALETGQCLPSLMYWHGASKPDCNKTTKI